ncbi:unnamed protein product [Nesidiocoris tenuis]|uniref:Reverse transcriptase domain-containing protein n=1 Tax=Nesidiocoris tenuis TaxID=355587 RepID=A0A6H5GI63_9HEMI|nr:unnamed protein product [Nesidiocoris tenuis]
MKPTIRIMSWNANGLLQRSKELEVVLNLSKIDICLISETHFTKETFFRMKGYKCYHALHPSNRARGGSAVLVKETIKHYESTKIEAEKYQISGIKIITPVYSLEKHSTIDQVHRIVNIIEEALEKKNVCSGIFLDVAQAFDKVWHEGLNHKLKKMLPYQYVELLESYLSRRYFCIKQEDAYSEPRTINAGVPQGSVIGPLLYLLYTCDLPETEENTTATFADDTAILAVGESNEESTQKLNRAISRISSWTAKWRIRLNEAKSVHIDFTNRSIVYTPTFINGVAIPYVNEAKYLGMTLDAKLRWKEHVKKKKTELVLKLRKMYWLIGRQSTMTIGNKLLLYKQVLKPVWSYGAQLWGCTAPTNRQIIQRFQNSVLRCITDAPWYFRNDALHRELNVDSVDQVIKQRASAHLTRLRDHLNEEAVKLLDVEDLTRRLKRTKPHELA